MIRSIAVRVPLLCGISLAMMGFLVSQVHGWSVSHILCLLLGIAGPTACIVCCLLATLPRTKSGNASLVFFSTIACRSLDEYGSAVKARSDAEYLDDLMCQVHRNAEICQDKHVHMKRATGSLLIGMLLWVVSVYTLTHLPLGVPPSVL